MKLGAVSSLVLIAAMSSNAWATNARVKTACYIDPQGVVQGTNPDKMTEIASVSKLLTSHWVISKVGPHHRFSTRIHITPVAADLFDVHIQGALDPSFNVHRMATLAANLNLRGVKKIRNLTFDQNFRYRQGVYSGSQVAGDPEIHVIKNQQITPIVRATMTNISSLYLKAKAAPETKLGEGLPESVSLSVADIKNISSVDFKKTPETKTLVSQSIEVYEIIKLMNLKSNNYIANILFDAMGGEVAYREFLKKDKGYTSAQVNFANGSGNPIQNYKGNGRFDNKATCRSIVTLIKDLRDKMSSAGMSFSSVVAVAGESHPNTLGVYATDLMAGALIAKTGTANPVVSLAGIASTPKGNIYFAVAVADGRPGRGSSGRQIIRQEVESIFRAYGGGDDINYTAESLFEVDEAAQLKEEVAQQRVNP